MANILSDLSDDLAAVVAKAGASVVRVEARRRLAASGVVWPGDGLVVTANHVVEQDGGIRVGLADGQVVTAGLVGRDPTADLALLRVEAGLTPPVWADTAALRAGHLVLALGRPGQNVRATLGIVSALGGGWVTPAGGRLESYVQPGVVMYPGFSGGPLVDSGSQVLGVNTLAVLRGATVTIPTSTVQRTVEALLAHGRVRRGYLGIGSQPVRLPPNVSERLGQETGLLIVNVAQGSPAEQSGLFLGDTLVALDGRPVRSADDLLAALSALQIGSAAQAKLVRGGVVVDMRVTVGEHP